MLECGVGACVIGLRTKIDANGTLIDFVTHVEDGYVVVMEEWWGEGGDVVQRRWASNFFTF